MREELNNIELIEKYVNNELTSSEKEAFEKKLKADPKFQKEFQEYKELMKGIERVALKQSSQNAYKRFKLGKNGFNFGLGLISLVVVATAAMLWYKNPDFIKSTFSKLFRTTSANSFITKNAGDGLPSQIYSIDNSKDTVIESRQGIIMIIPANCFLDKNNHTVKSRISFELKEALDAASIIKSGLTSKSGDKLLESAGMFFMNAMSGKDTLKIDPANGIYTEIPADEIKPDMMLFEGNRLADGSIDWVNPKEFEKFLTPVDINSLNFYPPNYLDTLASWGYDITDKRFTDSLYYSFEYLFELDKYNAMESDTFMGDLLYEDSFGHPMGIRPSKIKTIWDKKFENTLIATREFEERLKYIHQTCDNSILDIYAENLVRNLFEIDSVVAIGLSGNLKDKFLEFAARKDGKVKLDNKFASKLKAYYAKKQQAERDAIIKTQKKFWDKQSKLDKEFIEKQNEQNNKESKHIADNFSRELDLNLKEAYRQLGYDTPRPLPPAAAYRTVIVNTGWKNVDQYVLESLISRTTLDYTDPQTGKKAKIEYKPLNVKLVVDTYDQVMAYLVPNRLNSFERMKQISNTEFEYNLNELIQYQLIIVAFKADKMFYYHKEEVKPESYFGITLEEVDEATLDRKLYSLNIGSNSRKISKDVGFNRYSIKDQKRKNEIQKLVELKGKLIRTIFPCMDIIDESEIADIGENLFKANCSSCHATSEQKLVGPGLRGVTKRLNCDLIISFVRNPAELLKSNEYALVLFEQYNKSPMPPFPDLSDREIKAIFDYVDKVNNDKAGWSCSFN